MTRSSHWPALLVGAGVLSAGVLAACNEHVFRYVPDVCETNIVVKKDIEPTKEADILIVVDNSGSMCEEQDNLVRNFFDDSGGCPITDLNNVPAALKNPSAAQAQELATQCGFIQLLAAYENDFRVGVITTDVSECDNDFGQAATGLCGTFNDWGNRPQRGCLQAPPGADKKIIERSDTDIGERFRETLSNVRTFGSGIERGLDAMEVFLDPASTRAAGCEDDLGAFLRPDAKLVVIFLTDEEDCSHADGEYGFDDQGVDDAACGDPGVAVDLSFCYPQPFNGVESQFDKLAPIDRYRDFLNGLKPRADDVSVAVIAGAARDGDDIVAADCRIDGDGDPTEDCNPVLGNSQRPDFCGAGGTYEPCCVADRGTRYLALADALGGTRALRDSICYDSFRATMIEVAKFVGATDFVNLSEAPSDPEAVVVTLTRAGQEPEVLTRLPEDADCATETGFQLIGGTRVQFCGDARPGFEDKIDVHAADDRGDAGCILTDDE